MGPPHIGAIVGGHLHDPAAGRYRRIAWALRIAEAEVLAAQEFICGSLRPTNVVDFRRCSYGL